MFSINGFDFLSVDSTKSRARAESESECALALLFGAYSNCSVSGSCGTRSHTFKDYLRSAILYYPALRVRFFMATTATAAEVTGLDLGLPLMLVQKIIISTGELKENFKKFIQLELISSAPLSHPQSLLHEVNPCRTTTKRLHPSRQNGSSGSCPFCKIVSEQKNMVFCNVLPKYVYLLCYPAYLFRQILQFGDDQPAKGTGTCFIGSCLFTVAHPFP